MGKKRILAETGAGQHGVATATACALMGMECTVFMGALDVARQAPNVEKMRMLGATVNAVTSGNSTLKDATNEAIRFWCCNPEDCYYLIGSVVGPHPYPQMVAKFQSVISEEIEKQLLEKEGSPDPDYVIACVVGGSNAAGAFFNYLPKENVKLVAIEAAGLGLAVPEESAATLALGSIGIIHGFKTILMQDEYGQIIEPYSISAGLDYPGVGPMHAHLADIGRISFEAATDSQALQAAAILTRTEGIIPALESSHALAALEFMKFEKDDVVVVNLSGRGDKDMQTFIKHKI